MRRIIGIGCLIFILGLASCAEQPTSRDPKKVEYTDPADVDKTFEAVKDYDNGDYEIAIQKLKPIAEGGFSIAQYYLGQIYAEGKGVEQDFNEARKWYQLAADQGNVDAQTQIAYFYLAGKGVPQDVKKGYEILTLSAYEGDPNALYTFGVIHEKANLSPNRKLKAYQFYLLSQCYVQAYWPDRVGSATLAIKGREAIAKEMTEDETAEAYELAKAWAKAHPIPPLRKPRNVVGPGPLGTSRHLEYTSICHDF